MLQRKEVSAHYSKHVVAVDIDLATNDADTHRDSIERYNPSEARPVLVFLDSSGKMVYRQRGRLKDEQDALLLDEFISGKHYRSATYDEFRKTHSKP